MDSTDRQVLATMRRWAIAGQRWTLITVARAWGSAPRPAGAWMAVGHDGRTCGSVSGGCVEDDLLERMRGGDWSGRRPLVCTYGISQGEAERFGLPCGGTLELVIEPRPPAAWLTQLDEMLALGKRVVRVLDMATGEVYLEDAASCEAMSWDGTTLRTLHGPAWRLLIIGAGQIAHYLADMALALDYAVTVCDPRVEYRREWRVLGACCVEGMPDDVVRDICPDAHLAVVALTHDPRLDDMALLEALKSPAFYVGALGSAANSGRRRERLLKYFDLTAEQVDRLHGPVGLEIGSKTPPEIAVSILAEMTAVKYGRTGRSLVRRRYDSGELRSMEAGDDGAADAFFGGSAG